MSMGRRGINRNVGNMGSMGGRGTPRTYGTQKARVIREARKTFWPTAQGHTSLYIKEGCFFVCLFYFVCYIEISLTVTCRARSWYRQKALNE